MTNILIYTLKEHQIEILSYILYLRKCIAKDTLVYKPDWCNDKELLKALSEAIQRYIVINEIIKSKEAAG